MKLPYRNNCFVPKEKLTEYLLSEVHKEGKSKANFFLLMGFSKRNVEFLESELTNLAIENKVTKTKNTIFGMKYVILGMIKTPKGRSISISTVWIVDKFKKRPRFVTAYPLKRKSYTGGV